MSSVHTVLVLVIQVVQACQSLAWPSWSRIAFRSSLKAFEEAVSSLSVSIYYDEHFYFIGTTLLQMRFFFPQLLFTTSWVWWAHVWWVGQRNIRVQKKKSVMGVEALLLVNQTICQWKFSENLQSPRGSRSFTSKENTVRSVVGRYT